MVIVTFVKILLFGPNFSDNLHHCPVHMPYAVYVKLPLCYDIAFDRIANCNYMPSKNLNYNPPGILNRSIDIKSKTKITKNIIIVINIAISGMLIDTSCN